MSQSTRHAVLTALCVVTWSLGMLILGDLVWFNPTGAILVGGTIIALIGWWNYTGQIGTVTAAIRRRIRWIGLFFWLNKWLTLILIGFLMILAGGGPQNFGWWIGEVGYTTSEKMASFFEWLSWNPILNVGLVGIIVGGIIYLRRPAREVGLGLAGWGLLKGFNKFSQFETKGKFMLVGLILATLVLSATGRTVDKWIVVFVLVLVLYREWPRKNPFSSPPVDEFSLPVVRVLALPQLIPAFIGVTFCVFGGLLGAYILGEVYPMAIGAVTAQIFFLIWVDRMPGITNAWTTLTIYPAENMMIFDRARGGAGETSLVQLKLGPARFKERKGIADNLLRFLGWNLLEIEPLGVKREKGEQETFELWVNSNGWKFEFHGREIKGAKAFITWLATERA